MLSDRRPACKYSLNCNAPYRELLGPIQRKARAFWNGIQAAPEPGESVNPRDVLRRIIQSMFKAASYSLSETAHRARPFRRISPGIARHLCAARAPPSERGNADSHTNR